MLVAKPTTAAKRKLIESALWRVEEILETSALRGAGLRVPELFLPAPPLMNLPVTPTLQSGLEYLFREGNPNLEDLEGFPVRDLLEAGITWREILQLSHLMTWLPGAEDSDVTSLNRASVEGWVRDICRNLSYRLGYLADDLASLIQARLALGIEGRTLDELGQERGVSRERVRQIMTKVLESIKSVPMAGPSSVTRLPADWLGITSLLPDWEQEGIRNLAVLMGLDPEIIPSQNLLSETRRDAENPKVAEALRSSIGQSGFVNVQDLRIHLEDNGSQFATKALLLLEEKVTVLGSATQWALIQDGNKKKTARSAIDRQLELGKPLSAEELYIGVSRVLRSRSLGNELPPFDEFEQILGELSHLSSDGTKFQLRDPESKPLEGHQAWIVEYIGTSSDGLVSLEELVLAGARSGHLPSTTSRYVHTLEFLRLESNVCWVVSNPPSSPTLGTAIRRVQLLEEEGSLSFGALCDDGSTILNLTLGSTFVRSGQVSVPDTIRPMLSIRPRQLGCSCGASQGLTAGVTKNGQLSKGNWFLNHILTHNGTKGLGLGSTVSLKIDEEKVMLQMESR